MMTKGDKGDPGERGEAGPGMSVSVRVSFAVVTVVMLALAVAALILGARTADSLREGEQAQCQFDADLGAVPVTVSPATRTASKLGVTIVSDARLAWHGLHCPGFLAPPAPSFRKWAAYYHLPLG